MPTLGLLDNMVYDVIPQVAGATGNATVNASVYDVQCMSIPTMQILEPPSADGDSELNLVVTGTDTMDYQALLKMPCTT